MQVLSVEDSSPKCRSKYILLVIFPECHESAEARVLRNLTTVLSSTQGSCPQCKTFSLMQAQVHEKADAAAQECTCLAPRCCCCCCCTNWLMALRCALCTKYVLAVIGALSTGACTDKLRNARIFSAAHPAHPAHTKKLPLV